MGHKVHPIGFRLGVIFGWQSKWYAAKHYADLVHEDLAIRGFILKNMRDAAVSRVEIDRNANLVLVTIHTARPGIVIGRGGQKVDELRQKLAASPGATPTSQGGCCAPTRSLPAERPVIA